MAYITINYNEGDETQGEPFKCDFCEGSGKDEDDNECYRCEGTGIRHRPIYYNIEVSSSYEKNSKKTFDSGNFVKDWFDAIKYVLTELSEGHLSKSSSIDHFIMDGAPYDSAYLKDVNDEWILDYNYDHMNSGIEMFVPENTKPTWKELKEMCK